MQCTLALARIAIRIWAQATRTNILHRRRRRPHRHDTYEMSNAYEKLCYASRSTPAAYASVSTSLPTCGTHRYPQLWPNGQKDTQPQLHAVLTGTRRFTVTERFSSPPLDRAHISAFWYDARLSCSSVVASGWPQPYFSHRLKQQDKIQHLSTVYCFAANVGVGRDEWESGDDAAMRAVQSRMQRRVECRRRGRSRRREKPAV